jgi:hypothetical protein
MCDVQFASLQEQAHHIGTDMFSFVHAVRAAYEIEPDGEQQYPLVKSKKVDLKDIPADDLCNKNQHTEAAGHENDDFLDPEQDLPYQIVFKFIHGSSPE